MSVIERLQKRRAYPVSIDGDVIHIRALRASELAVASGFQNDDESIGFVIGYGVVNDDGSQAILQVEGETAKDFGARVLSTLDLPLDTRSEITSKIMKLSNGPLSEDELKKN